MSKTILKAALSAILVSFGSGALADGAENAVPESRAALKELWAEPRGADETPSRAAATLHNPAEIRSSAMVPTDAWADNYAAGRVHEPAGHGGGDASDGRD